MRRFWRFATRSRRSKIVSAITALAVAGSLAGVAYAWIVTTTGAGSAGGVKVATATQHTITFQADGTGAACAPGATCEVKVSWSGYATPDTGMKFSTVSKSGIALVQGQTQVQCDVDSLVTLNAAAWTSLAPFDLTAGGSKVIPGGASLGAGLPVCASGGTISIPITATLVG